MVVVGYGIDGREAVLAIVLGSGIAVFSNAYFTFQAFRFDASKQPMKAMTSLYRGEAGKIILVIVLTALSFKYLELQQPLLLILAMFVLMVTQSLASVLLVQSIDKQIIDGLKDKNLIEPSNKD